MSLLIDTGALNVLQGNDGRVLSDLNNKITDSDSQLCVTHVQVDERYASFEEYNSKLSKMVEDFSEKGLSLHIKMTEITVFGVSRFGTSKLGSESQSDLFNELKKLIAECEKWKKTEENVFRDSIIGISALNYDAFITTDICLSKSMKSLIICHQDQIENPPKIIRRNPKLGNIREEIEIQLKGTS